MRDKLARYTKIETILYANKKYASFIRSVFLLVEVARLELAASWSLTKRATKLRYTSTNNKKYTILRKNCQGFCMPA